MSLDLPSLAAPPEGSSLLDLVDQLLEQGCVVTGRLVLGLAGVDLVYVELSALLCTTDHLMPGHGTSRAKAADEAGGAET